MAALSVLGTPAAGRSRGRRSPAGKAGWGSPAGKDGKLRGTRRPAQLALRASTQSLRSSVSENSARMSGMSASPNAISSRLDIQQSFQELFFDKTTEEVTNSSRFNRMALDNEDNADSIEMLKRKMRAASYRGGIQDWEKLFQQYDRDGSGELDRAEFIRAIRRDVGVSRADFSDGDLERLFKKIDVDGSGEISAEEFKNFIAYKPSARAAEHTSESSHGEDLQSRDTCKPFVAEYICVRRAVLREGPSLRSPKVGVLQPGEIVAVVRSQGIRLKCVRLRWGDEPGGWASERSDNGMGEPMLEKLARNEWSAYEKNDTAIATRVASLRSAQQLQKHVKQARVPAIDDKGAYWTSPLREFLSEGRLRENAKLPAPPRGWTHAPTPRGMAAAELIGGCESIDDVHTVLTALENKSKREWPEEIERQRSEISINEQASRIWSEASFSAVDRAMQRRQSVGALSSKSAEDMAYSKAWAGPREIKYSKPSAPDPPKLTGIERAAQDVEAIGQEKVQEALEQVAALITTAEEEGVESQQVESLRQSMEQLRRAL